MSMQNRIAKVTKGEGERKREIDGEQQVYQLSD